MRDYWLSKLIDAAGEVNSRKRLQKAIYLLQFRKQFPLQLDYFLHYYGPFSRELADLMDRLTSLKIVSEQAKGLSFSSCLTDHGKDILRKYEMTDSGQKDLKALKRYISEFISLMDVKNYTLELAATIAYFYTNNCPDAKERTSKFKKVPLGSTSMKEACALAGKYRLT